MSMKITALYARSAYPNPEHISEQISSMEDYAHNNGLSNLYNFTDDGASGTTQDRPALNALMNEIRNHKIETVVVADMCRLSRNFDLCQALIKDLLEQGVRVICIKEHLDYLPKHIHDDDNGLDYELNGDYYFPVIGDPEQEDKRPIGKWGQMHMKYLEEERPGLYLRLLLGGTLHRTLADVNEAALRRINGITLQLKKAEGVTEKLKAEDQMEWVRRMNSIQNRAEEVVKAELIYT